MKTRILLVTVSLMILGQLPLRAAEIVNFGQATDIVTGLKTMSVGAGATTINLTTPSNPALDGTYYPNNTGRNPIFYALSYCSVNNGASQLRFENNRADASNLVYDTLHFSLDAGAATPHQAYGLVLWTKTNAAGYGFLSGFDTAPATLVSLTAIMKQNSFPDYHTNRFVIRLGDTFYASERLATNPFVNVYGTQTLVVATATWYEYDPLTDARVIGPQATISDFGNCTAVGYLYCRGNSARYSQLEIAGFFAEAIPEPTLLVFFSGVSVLLARRAMTA